MRASSLRRLFGVLIFACLIAGCTSCGGRAQAIQARNDGKIAIPAQSLSLLNEQGQPTSLTLTTPETLVLPGAEFTLPVTVSDRAGLAGMAVRLQFDPLVLQCQSVAAGDWAGETTKLAANATGTPGTAAVAVAGYRAASTGPGVIASFRLKAVDSAAPQNAALSITAVLADASGKTVGRVDTTRKAAGALTRPQSAGTLIGDLLGTGQPEVGSAIKILRVVVGLDAQPAAGDLWQWDCDNSGAVEVGDAVKLLRCVVGLDAWPITAQTNLAFDGSRAMASIKAQCAFGFRTPGSDAHEQCKTYLQAELAKYADKVILQEFTSKTPLSGDKSYPFTNIIGVFSASAPGDPLVMLSHWDSRPIADQDPTMSARTQPVMAANDGASGVAVLLELARSFKLKAPPRPIIILFVDAEDSGKDYADWPYEGFCIGTKYYVDHLPAGIPTPKEGILLDMVGSLHDFKLDMEQFSLDYNPVLVNKVWTAAEELHHAAFVRQAGPAIIDDHMPLNDAGIKSIDIIHWHPVEWHTTLDTPENCSPDSLFQVGDTLLRVIYGN